MNKRFREQAVLEEISNRALAELQAMLPLNDPRVSYLEKLALARKYCCEVEELPGVLEKEKLAEVIEKKPLKITQKSDSRPMK